MIQVEKNSILQQVGSVLQFCHEILSRLSSLPSPDPEDNNDDMEANHQELIETNNEFRDEEQEYDNDLWWDASYPPSHFYTKVFDDDDVSLYNLDASYADFLMLSDMLEDAGMTTSKSRDVMMMSAKSTDVMMTEDKSTDVMMIPENKLMKSVISLVDVAAMNAIYCPRWRKSQRRKVIHPEFYNMWDNFDFIFDDDKDDVNILMEEAIPEIKYHTIDFTMSMPDLLGTFPSPATSQSKETQ